jgi:hypothetical protein
VDLGDASRATIGHAVAVVAVHPSNPVPALDAAQAGRLLRAEEGWSALGSDAGAARVVLRGPASELLALANATLLGSAPAPRGLEVVESEAAARALVASDPHAVSVLALATAEGAGGAVRVASREGALRFPVYALTRGPATGPARALLDWLRAPDVAPVLRAQSVIE